MLGIPDGHTARFKAFGSVVFEKFRKIDQTRAMDAGEMRKCDLAWKVRGSDARAILRFFRVKNGDRSVRNGGKSVRKGGMVPWMELNRLARASRTLTEF